MTFGNDDRGVDPERRSLNPSYPVPPQPAVQPAVQPQVQPQVQPSNPQQEAQAAPVLQQPIGWSGYQHVQPALPVLPQQALSYLSSPPSQTGTGYSLGGSSSSLVGNNSGLHLGESNYSANISASTAASSAPSAENDIAPVVDPALWQYNFGLPLDNDPQAQQPQAQQPQPQQPQPHGQVQHQVQQLQPEQLQPEHHQPQPQGQPQTQSLQQVYLQQNAGIETTGGETAQAAYGGHVRIDSAFCRHLARQPAIRTIIQRRPDQALNLARRSNVEALLGYVTGQPAAQSCRNCVKGHGPWTQCVVLQGHLQGSCTNCWFNASGMRCTFQGDKKLRQQQNQEAREAREAQRAQQAQQAPTGQAAFPPPAQQQAIQQGQQGQQGQQDQQAIQQGQQDQQAIQQDQQAIQQDQQAIQQLQQAIQQDQQPIQQLQQPIQQDQQLQQPIHQSQQQLGDQQQPAQSQQNQHSASVHGSPQPSHHSGQTTNPNSPAPPRPRLQAALPAAPRPGFDLGQRGLAGAARRALRRGLDETPRPSVHRRLMARIEAAAEELGMRIAEFEDYARSPEGVAFERAARRARREAAVAAATRANRR
ncbi:hypothetical protein GQ602_001282 [Ophiocordyceps camponoti-floridani]|uniref:Uncharacterized protein n=1 Tax=Ophiocordyceps camponoti-floridani TaxID=2030778 RepID=A0A8H4QDS0_9HYPO|nr:hypothetical protein GQ602_001282 [Ophiocordyceps camponoti-floridani]